MQPHPTCGVVNLAVVQQVLLASPQNVLLLEGMTPWNYTSSPKKERQDLSALRQLGGGGEAFECHGKGLGPGPPHSSLNQKNKRKRKREIASP